MKTLRLLLWLRWMTFLRTNAGSNRFTSILMPLLMLLAFTPIYIGGAVAAYKGVRTLGAPAVLVALGACQIAWIYFGLLFGAMGRSFDLDRLLRYPLRPAAVYATNVLTACLEPVCLMTLPTLLAVALGAWHRAGPLAGAATLLAGLLLTLVTSALLQLLLAVLDELLEREWVRYLAITLFSFTFIGLQIVLRGLSRSLVARITQTAATPAELVAFAAAAFGKVPTIVWPAALATGAIDARALPALGGLAGTALLLVLLLLPGAALMRHTARAGERGGSAGGRRTPGRGSVALVLPGLPRMLALLFTRELRYTLQNPQRLVTLFVTPLILVAFSFQRSGSVMLKPAFVILLLGSSLTNAAITQFSYDGPGVRQFFLLPCPLRDVLLAKNLEFLARGAIQILLVYLPLTLLAKADWSALGWTIGVGATAVLFATTAIGTWISIRWPVRARRRGLSTRGDTGPGGFVMLGGTLAAAALVGLTIWAARAVAAPAWAGTAGLVTGAVFAAGAAAIWWISLERNAAVLLASREKLIETIAKIEAG